MKKTETVGQNHSAERTQGFSVGTVSNRQVSKKILITLKTEGRELFAFLISDNVLLPSAASAVISVLVDSDSTCWRIIESIKRNRNTSETQIVTPKQFSSRVSMTW